MKRMYNLFAAMIIFTMVLTSCENPFWNIEKKCLHQYGEWTTKTEATCVAKEAQEKICSLCGDKQTQEIGEIDLATHIFDTIPATCTTDSNPGTCTREGCDEVNPEAVVASFGHFFYNRNCSVLCFAFDMVLVEKGTFLMGPDIHGNNATVEATFTKDFNISKYQVTQELYLAVMGTNPSYFHGGSGREPEADEVQGKRPVEQVNWYHAIAFCNRLSILEGLAPVYTVAGISNTNADAWLHSAVPTGNNATWNAVTPNWSANGYRLPTDAQWEYAAKGGNESEGYTYSGSDDIDEVAWYSGNSGDNGTSTNRKTHEVGLKASNELGIYDMSGNVWEWCWDWWGSYPGTAQTDFTGAAAGSNRVLRGGSWYNSAEGAQSVSRNGINPDNGFIDLGFRLVLP